MLDDVVVRQGPTTSVRIRQLIVHYSISQVVRGNAIVIDRLDVDGLAMSIVHLPSNGLNIGSLIKKRPPSTGPRRRRGILTHRNHDEEDRCRGDWRRAASGCG